jgi:hypothetical protein
LSTAASAEGYPPGEISLPKALFYLRMTQRG